MDCITLIGVQMFDVPVCLISLLHTCRQWVKSCIGLAAGEAQQSLAFCEQVAARGAPLIVEDTQAAVPGRGPLVLPAPNTRFYAGYPIGTWRGPVLGTVCLADFKPRKFNDSQRHLMQHLAAIAEITLCTQRAGAVQTAPIAAVIGAHGAALRTS